MLCSTSLLQPPQRWVQPAGSSAVRPAALRTCLPAHRWRQLSRCATGAAPKQGGGFGGGGGSGAKFYDSEIKDAREKQIKATDLLAKLLQAPNAKAVAQQHLNSLTEEFFHIANTYMQMAQKEGNTEVYDQMKAALTAALEVKQATLRPEIQLLNKLLAVDGAAAWQQVLGTKEAGEQLTMNGGFFFQLLDRMAADVARQPDNPQKGQLQQKLAGIRQAAEARQPPK